ncbi:hypothetical protein N7540_003326 [Penicillium herquei]|nr:hypothetical protein N7540_003326 [Penicillium herquei]
MGRLIARGLAKGIGLVSEAIHDSRDKSSTTSTPRSLSIQEQSTEDIITHDGIAHTRSVDVASNPVNEKELTTSANEKLGLDSDSSDSDNDLDQDEAIWYLDESARDMTPPPSYTEIEAPSPAADDTEEIKQSKEEAMVRAVVQLAGPISGKRIPCPVIIPQRRPGAKDRGFVQTYAPVLAECGIGQDAFLGFLDTFHKASKASRWLEVLYLGANVVGFVPETAAQITGILLSFAVGTARELQTRTRRNNYLDKVNQDLFMPRGLFAMVMSFKDKVPSQGTSNSVRGKTVVSSQLLDISETAVKYSTLDPETSKFKRNLRLASGVTHGEIGLPESAPLVYPNLDQAALGNASETSRIPSRGGNSWVSDYFDRKAQSEFEYRHPGSVLAVPESQRKKFASRYNDPDHPVNNGRLISVITGGRIGKTPKKYIYERVADAMKDPNKRAQDQSTTTPRNRRSIIGKTFQPDVLYLIIVNLPTEEEMKESLADLERLMEQAENSAPAQAQ